MAGIFILSGLLIWLKPKPGRRGYLDWFFMASLTAYAMLSANQDHTQNGIWMYYVPLAAFFLFSLRQAIYFTLVFTPIALYISLYLVHPLHSAQVFFGFAVISTSALFLAMVKTRTNMLLEPLIGTDEETGAQLEQKLRPALATEINRAEREGTGLLLMHIDLADIQASKDSIREFSPTWAHIIHKELRPFDQYYRLEPSGFAIILPHMNTEDGQQLMGKILNHLPENIRPKVKIGLASLNVGDSAHTLITNAQKVMSYV